MHDIGVKPSGEIYFTMKLVRGRSLAEVLKDLVIGSRQVRREWNLHKLVSVLERVCEALHFAHEKGVLHRDLKPGNVMLGEYGEVHVVDWGLVKVAGSEGERDEDTVEVDGVLHTQVGTVKGTIPYMSPEQARGEDLDRRSDVYAIGCVLYEMLTLRPAFEGGSGRELLERVAAGDVPPLRERNAKRAVPEALAEICERAMAHSPTARPDSAGAVADALRAWLDGRAEEERRRDEAKRLTAEGLAAKDRWLKLVAEIKAAETHAEEEAARLQPWQPIAEKRSAYEAQQRVTELKDEMVVAFADATNALNAALASVTDHTPARHALCDLWKMRLQAAERTQDRNVVVFAERNIRRHDDGRLARFLEGTGTLELASEPPGAEVLVYRFEDEDGILVPRDERSLGCAPFGPVELPMGSYLCILKLDGFRDVRYPVYISRNRKWKGTVRMRTDEEIGDEFVYVPGGPFEYGEGRDGASVTVPSFLIRRKPVTTADWAAFLSALERENGVDSAAERIPRTTGDGPYFERSVSGEYRPVSSLIPERHRERYTALHGDDWATRLPVLAVSWHDAIAYCDWMTRSTRRQWRLPTEFQYEKAVRGVDGRRFPWGDRASASLCKNRDSRDEPSQPEPVGAFPTAESVYEVVDAAGGSWDWTRSPYEPHASTVGMYVVRGGCWHSPVTSTRAALRDRYAPEHRSPHTGFRPAIELHDS